MSAVVDSAPLTLEEPETVRAGANSYRCGGITFRVVRAVAAAPKGAVSLKALAVAVWGKTLGPEIAKGTIKTAVCRANDVLAGIGARERILIDGDVALLG